MKKSLIALAALAATGAFAQSSVTIQGVIDAGVTSVTGSEASATNTKGTRVEQNNTATSQINLLGVEDLGGGLKASFFLEQDFKPVQGGQSMTSGQQYVGLAGNFGSVKLGNPNAAALETNAVAQPFGTALGGGYSANFGRFGVLNDSITTGFAQSGSTNNGARLIRHDRTARYDSPNFSGFSGSLEYSFQNDSNVGGSNSNRYAALGLKYGNGPLNVAFAHSRIEGGNPAVSPMVANGDWKNNFLAANYDFGVATVYGGFSTTKNGGFAGVAVEDARSYNVAVKVPFGAFAFAANVLRVDDRTVFNMDRNLIGLGLDYNLSKRTALYGRYENIKFMRQTALGEDLKRNTFAVGLRHAF